MLLHKIGREHLSTMFAFRIFSVETQTSTRSNTQIASCIVCMLTLCSVLYVFKMWVPVSLV